ncbi:MAG: U32 family peptidase, partial [Methanobacteriota archaeon]
MGESIIPELLAPAGSPDALYAAIAAGADAVYLGGRKFGARHFASNFDDSLLVESVSYAHLRGVKVYLTVNTLIHDTEIPELADYLLFLFSIGVDAILIQDIGVLSLARELYSELKSAPALHASTQMAIHNREGAVYAVQQGCKRVVLARELPIPEVRDISIALHDHAAEIEIFTHGALCYAYSGQCLLSAIIGGRSGNRGMCAQPCRKPYDMIRGRRDQYGRIMEGKSLHLNDEYLLSTHDLSIYPVLKEILSLPIAALKIEGRMRSPSYVATVTDIYRRAIDAIQMGIFLPTHQEETDLILAFSRGFTTGYLNQEESHRVMGRDCSGRRGILIGTVKEMTYRGVIVQPAGDVIPEHGDGMVCITGIDEQGFVLHRDALMRGTVMELETNARCNQGDQIYLTARGRTTKDGESLMQDPDRRYSGSILLDVRVIIDPEGGILISGEARTRAGIQISYSFSPKEKFIPARSRPLTIHQIAESMRKTGGTLFSIQKIEITCPDGFFAPISMLNGIRRELLDHIKTQILNVRLPSFDDVAIVSERKNKYLVDNYDHSEKKLIPGSKPDLIGLVSDIRSLQASLASKSNLVYIEWYPDSSEKEDSNLWLDSLLRWIHDNPNFREQVGIKLPKIMRR